MEWSTAFKVCIFIVATCGCSFPSSLSFMADSLWSEPPWKLKNTGVGSLFLLQRIFLTQESNQGLLNCRWILYQWGYHKSDQINILLNSSEASYLIPCTSYWKTSKFLLKPVASKKKKEKRKRKKYPLALCMHV